MAELIILLAAGGGLVSLAVRLRAKSYEVLKRGLDLVISIPAMLLFAPALLVCAVIIKLSSEGPVFYSQIRAGRHGRPFRMYKLRTMGQDAESATGAVWASDDDPRVIPACRWMRRSHMDELPQLLNVLFGDMSLVGPRPERPEIIADLEKHYPYARKRLAAVPGITGLAQVRWGYDTTPERFRRKLGADLEYIAMRNLMADFRIIVATLPKFVDKSAR